MTNAKKLLGLVGSPRKDGLTNRLVARTLRGDQAAGAETEIVQMSDHVVDACKDCLPWVCRENLKCTYPDAGFETLTEKLHECGGLVLGTPVYWGDTSAMVRFMMLKLFRVFAGSRPFSGIPAFGIAIAGGSGNGLLTGLQPLYHFFRIMWMRAIEPLPATRFDLDSAGDRAEAAGKKLAGLLGEPRHFEDRDERDFWFDSIPGIGQINAAERRLLASITYETVPEKDRAGISGSLAEAEILGAAGKKLEAMKEVSRVYDSCLEIINRQQGR